MTLDVVKAGVLLFFAAIVQASILASLEIAIGVPDLVLVTLVAVALLRGAIFGAAAGFFVGLVLDTAYLATLGLTSLLLTIAGYCIGRYGETTGRCRTHAPLLSVAVVTVLYAVGSLVLRFVIGDPAPARAVLVESLVPTILLNLLLTFPVYAACRRVLGRPEWKAREVRLLA